MYKTYIILKNIFRKMCEFKIKRKRVLAVRYISRDLWKHAIRYGHTATTLVYGHAL